MRAATFSCLRSFPSSLHRHVHLSAQQRRWARVRDVRFVATQQASVGVTDRYRRKLEQKAREAGVQDIDQLKEAYKEKIMDLRKQAAVPGMTAPLTKQALAAQLEEKARSEAKTKASGQTSPDTSHTLPLQPSASSTTELSKGSPTGPTVPGIKTLSSFLDVTKVLDLPQREIEALWRLRHAQNPASLCAAIPTTTWASIHQTARKHPLFILPGLPKKAQAIDQTNNETKEVEEAAPIHLLQWTFPSPTTATVIFTHLAEYKLRGEYAQPHTTLTHHLDLAGPKSLILSEGVVIDGRGVSVEEGKWLVMNMQKFYNTGEEAEKMETSDVGRELKARRRKLVERFARGDESFKIEDLIEETERMG